ncbi:two-component sensor histidine kinase [Marinilactibacillus sp. 15R]|uniref:sensor histidine kinase n=1 Tax=Marinilactibacillus sp. 15R TaxID=1911586 RepID=UPI00090C4042|nr:HAMP domain-containing sensor histidine kinase [Marinilactibacillus sp. 15R]API88180.1 two-component sensor histidine kinase [Marinilactibacillus sp. 15R]
MKLTLRERFRLLIEGFVTAGIILLCYFATYEIMGWFVEAFPSVFGNLWFIEEVFLQDRQQDLWGITPFVLFLLVIVAVGAIYWRLKRRYRQYELRHIIDELHFIAQGNYTHKIRGKYSGDIGKVVDSIHVLVDSTVEAMEEERRIEQSKDELITNVSHDIRTPLTSIIGYLGLIEEGRFRSTDELQKYVHTAYQKAKQMKVLVDDLFEYTKVRQTTTPLQCVSFDMIQLIEQLAIDFELEAQSKEVEIIVHSPFERLMMIADTEKLVRVFNNLISNALKYGKGGNIIKIEVDKVDSQANISVKNDGEALPKEAVEQIFERFYRAEISRSQETAGTGLGLAIAQSIIELHGGTITAKSDDDWTSFDIQLPLEQKM